MSHVFAGSFSSITSDQCYLSSLHNPFMSCIQPVCHLSFTINWLTPACSQLPTPTFSTHFLNFQTNTSLFLPCYWSSLGGAHCKHFQSYFITAVLQISVFDANRNLHKGWTADVLQPLPVMTAKLVFLHPSSSAATWRKLFVSVSSLSDFLIHVCTTTMWTTMARVVVHPGQVMPQ